LPDIIVVGGGFVGNFLAYLLARKGIHVQVFEEHREIGHPPHCAGVVSKRGLKRLGIYSNILREGAVLSTHKCIRIWIGREAKIFYLKEDTLLVIDRPLLDKILFEKAQNRGAEYFLGEKVKELRSDGHVKAGTKLYKSKIVADAEGASKRLISRLLSYRPEVLPAFQMDIHVEDYRMRRSIIDVYVNVPDFFSWTIPLKENIVRIGIASRYVKNKYEFLKRLAKAKYDKFRVLNMFGGLVNVGGPIEKFVFGKIAVVGDAAGQTKPTTGGGIVWGGISAGILAKIIELNLNGDVDLRLYEKVWRDIFGANLSFMLMLRKALYFGDPQLKLRFAFLFLPDIVYVSSDYDFQLDFIRRIF